MGHLHDDNADLVSRTRRIAGQVDAIERALRDGTGCSQVMHLVAAVRGAVNGLMEEIVAEHVEHHVARPGLSAVQRAEGAHELLAVIRRYSK